MINQETLKTFENLYSETYNNVLKYVVVNCSNIEDVKDIVQNTYLEVFKILNKKKDLELTCAYILGIAKNKVNEYYRFNYKNKIVSLFSPKNDLNVLENIPDNIDIDKIIINQDNIDFIWNFLKKKKVIISKIFYLYYYEDLTINEISNLLNISDSNVKNYLYRTLKELECLMRNGGEKDV